MSAVRKAQPDDIEAIASIIEYYALQGIMLPRSQHVIEQQLSDFVVAVYDGHVVGCGSLCQLGDDLVEIRSLGVANSFRGKGLGRLLVTGLTEEAKRRRIPKLMALTYETSFFLRNGFQIVSKEIFPEKVWKDCKFCPKQDCCDEIAVLRHLDT